MMGPATLRPRQRRFQSRLATPWRQCHLQTPEADAIDQWSENFRHYEATPGETAAASLDVNFTEEFSAIEQYPLLHHVLQQMARADHMTALLSTAVGGSMQSQMEARLANIANTVGNSSDFTATLARQHAKLNAAHRISAPALASSGERGTWAGVLGQITDFPCLSAGPAFLSPRADGDAVPSGLYGLSAVVSDSWASMVNTPRLTMFQKTSSNNNNGQTVDLAAAKLNDLYGSSNVLRLDGPNKFCRPSKGHIQQWRVRRRRRPYPGSPCAWCRPRPKWFFKRPTQWWWRSGPLNGMNGGMNPFNMNMNMLNLAAMGVSPEAQLLAAQIAATGGGFGQPGLVVGAGLGTFGGLQGGVSGLRGGIDDLTTPPPPPPSSGGSAPGVPGSSGGSVGSGGGPSG
ncbi:hypothetical protein EDB92DRAFT_1818962 [Lactarius akahatsu]|uniref:Uncharacterized protein n=1 Tax=Lactarius akahatsu TaxID=416441 RepID=A0AAD4LAU9_9AGAM|nr:hypothetical protein EDB92DRAFT_1818962 [Lactarius akahatsu]